MPILEVKNIVKNFGKIQVLKGIDFSMEKGEVVAVIGSSGSGKTTLLRCINFLEDADSGKILVDGKCIYDGESTKKLTPAQIRENQLNFGLVFQSFNLFPQYTALENVTLAPKMLAKERPDFKQNKKKIYAEIEDNAKALLSRVPEYDVLITAESKGIPLAYEMARQRGGERYLLARKAPKLYMRDVIKCEVQSITTVAKQTLYLDGYDAEYMKGKRVLIVDDVISTGESLNALVKLVEMAGGNIVGMATVLAEGEAADRDDIIFLEKLPLFDSEGRAL